MASPAGPVPAETARPAWLAALAARLSALAAVGVAVGVGAWLGAWWVPFACGVAAGFLRVMPATFRRGPTTAAVVGAVIGWLVPIWVLALRGQPVGATARAIAGLAGLPPYAGVTIAVLALLAALQVWVGSWLARAVLPRKTARPADETRPAAGRSKHGRHG